MKANVDAAIPILTRMNYGYWGAIGAAEAEILSRWIAQFTMSYEFADRRTAMIPQEVRSHFAQDGGLIGNWLIAVGVADPQRGTDPVFHRGLGLRDPRGVNQPAQATVFMFGKLFCCCVYSAFATPPQVVGALADMKLATLRPFPVSGISRPIWLHNEETIPIVIDAITQAFQKSVRDID